MADRLRSFRGVARLGFAGFSGLVDVVQQMHETIAGRLAPRLSPAPASTRISGSRSARIYGSVRSVNGSLALILDRSLGALAPEQTRQSGHPSRAVVVLNGICGDYLETTGNPLAIPMALHTEVGTPCGARIALLVHGLCLSEQSWRRRGRPSIGDKLRDELGYTPVYARYNSGRHISTNGRELAERLERTIREWPVPVESLVMLGHSMGGLVLRSACWYGMQARHTWVDLLDSVICLGTPHHGSPLEQGGHAFTAALSASPYLAPLALGRHRSAGIKDLRYGSLLDEDWQRSDADSDSSQPARPVPLLENVEYYMVAATLGEDSFALRGQWLGDLLVPTESAMGLHPDALRRMRVPLEHCRIFHGMNHFDLLDHPTVHDQILDWLRPGGSPSGTPWREPEGP
jgi:pimeloyl-ACP methyl ester carboxylesterase